MLLINFYYYVYFLSLHINNITHYFLTASGSCLISRITPLTEGIFSKCTFSARRQYLQLTHVSPTCTRRSKHVHRRQAELVHSMNPARAVLTLLQSLQGHFYFTVKVLKLLLYSKKMPKRLVSGGWIEKPCIFRSPIDATPDCTFCQEPFTFWNGRRHCAFCGHVFHRLECTRKCSIEGEFFRRRICAYCDRYRGVYKQKLCTGT